MVTLFVYIIIYIIYNLQTISAQSIPPTCLPSSVCDGKIPCSEHGHCYYDLMNFNTQDQKLEDCICDSGFATKVTDSISCCYEQKTQIMAFMLEFVIGFGSGHFYLERTNYFIVKFSCYCLFYCSFYTIAVCFCYNNDEQSQKSATATQKFFNIVLILSCCLIIVWQMIDATLIDINWFKDGNGMMPHPW